jgi:hypothetical protein
MRVLLDIIIPHEPFNSLVREGTAGEILRSILDEQKPEAVYFTERGGKRGLTMIVDVEDPSKVPFFAEPWFLRFQADVHFRIVMSPEDLGKAGLDALGKKWS